MAYSLTGPDAVILDTRIPESHRVEGLEYGRHVSLPHRGRSGYYVRPEGTEQWALAYLTPASDELHDTDAEIAEAIREEIAEVHEAIEEAIERGGGLAGARRRRVHLDDHAGLRGRAVAGHRTGRATPGPHLRHETRRQTMTIRTIQLPPAFYGTRQALGGGEVRDVMPYEGATAYVTDGERYGVQYEDGHVDWLGTHPATAFGEGAEAARAAAPYVGETIFEAD